MSAGSRDMPTTRMEAFSDGVIAVIITIMVLELHVPHNDGFAAVKELAPRLAVYLLSFTMTGIYWLNHHELLRRVERVRYGILVANLLWLFVLSLLPLSTEYVGEKHFSSFAVAQYAVVLMGAGLSFGMLRLLLLNVQRQSGELSRRDTVEGWKHAASLALYLFAIAAAFVHPDISLALSAMVTLVWLVPSFGTHPLTHEAHHAALLHKDESR